MKKLILVVLLFGCAKTPKIYQSKPVVEKHYAAAPGRLLIAEDRTFCFVTLNDFADAKVGERFMCDWQRIERK